MVFDRLADKWSLLIVKVLRQGPCRFNQLRREIEGISQKALSQTLQKLERDGVVDRKAFATVPVTVEYSLTTLGRGLSDLIQPLAAWAEQHIEQVQRAQQRYDRRRTARTASHD
nr:helix-turn-helix domain-containing protein [Solimonas marina]